MSLSAGCFHVYSKSISGYQIFRYDRDCLRFIQAAQFYQFQSLPMSYADFLNLNDVRCEGGNSIDKMFCHREWNLRAELLSYCVMTTHIHLVVREIMPGGLSGYMSDLLNSYTRYFNLRYGRKGPLWQGRFGRRPVTDVDDLLNVSAYVHLNPVVERMVDHPCDWKHSSFRELYGPSDLGKRFLDSIEMNLKEYTAFIFKQIGPRRKEKRAKSNLRGY